MKKLFINSKGQVILKEIRSPLIETKGTLVRTSYALISSGTELFIIKSKKIDNLSLIKRFLKSKNFRKRILTTIKENSFKKILNLFRSYRKREVNKNFPIRSFNLTPIGYSCSGIVQESNIENYKINERVACAGSNHAEIVFSPKNLTCKIPDNVSLEEAAFTTLGAIALHGIHRADIKPGEFLGVIGTGLIGLLAVQIAKASGARVIAIDLINSRLNLSKKLGADLIINPLYYNTKIKVDKFTMGHGLDSVVICASSNSSKPLEDAVDLIRDKGRIVMLGGFPINVDRSKLYYKEADLLISRSYGAGRYDPYYEYEGFDYPKEFISWSEQRNMELFLRLLSEKKIDVKPLITGIFPVENSNLAYEKLEKDPIKNIALILKFTSEKQNFDIVQSNSISKKISKKLVIGLIGCGSFAQNVHLPILFPDPLVKIKAICTQSKKTAELCKRKYNPEYTTIHYKDILNDPEISTVLIYTKHDTHANFTIEAIKADKNVYVEKPMGITEEECKKVYQIVKNSRKNYIIGFNRRYSPFIKTTKELLKDVNNPIILSYRIANPFLSGDHWGFDPKIGGGPIIGEFCHFIDLILFLINSKPVELIAKGGSLSHKNTNVFDSCVVIIKFENGSIANLIYTDLNGPNMEKERIEIYSGDSAIIINDFKTMITSGFNCGNLFLDFNNKGHENELKNMILTNLGLIEPNITVNDAIKTMDLVFKTNESIKTNKAIKIDTNIY